MHAIKQFLMSFLLKGLKFEFKNHQIFMPLTQKFVVTPLNQSKWKGLIKLKCIRHKAELFFEFIVYIKVS